jgi:hypothetical protein
VRIEDDVLVTGDNPEVLSKSLISSAEEIEQWMNSSEGRPVEPLR